MVVCFIDREYTNNRHQRNSFLGVLKLTNSQITELVSHARESFPHECCGLIGGNSDGTAQTVYPARNVAPEPQVAYEAAPEDLFSAQRSMRARNEQLLAIYHSHPNASDPQPSVTDMRLAYYPTAVYLILGMGGSEPCVRAFRISEKRGHWEPIEWQVIADPGH